MLNQMSFKTTLITTMDRSSTVAPYAHRLYARARWAQQRKQLRAKSDRAKPAVVHAGRGRSTGRRHAAVLNRHANRRPGSNSR